MVRAGWTRRLGDAVLRGNAAVGERLYVSVPMTRAVAAGSSEMAVPSKVRAEPGRSVCVPIITCVPEIEKGMLPISMVVGMGEGWAWGSEPWLGEVLVSGAGDGPEFPVAEGVVGVDVWPGEADSVGVVVGDSPASVLDV